MGGEGERRRRCGTEQPFRRQERRESFKRLCLARKNALYTFERGNSLSGSRHEEKSLNTVEWARY